MIDYVKLVCRGGKWWLTPLFLLMVSLFTSQPIQAAPLGQVTCGSAMTVANQSELNAAIVCFNGETDPGEYVITLANDIVLTASTEAINNIATGISLRIDGAGFTVDGQDNPLSDPNGVRPFEIAEGTTVTIENTTVTGGNVGGIGGGILNEGMLTITHSSISHNTADFGGGIYNGGTLTIHNSVISSNTSSYWGGGIHNYGTLTIRNSTISNNTASGGGGIHNDWGTLTIRNSTISNNTANFAGGLYQGGVVAQTTLHNTLIANSTGTVGDCVNIDGTINASHSLIETGLACINGTNTDNLTGDPLLGDLADNGGPTWTHALGDNSPAIDQGSNTLIPAQTYSDQRGAGFIRIANGVVDLGAFEANSACLPFPRTVGTEAELNNAIACYNTMDQPGEYLITLTADIPLTLSTMIIDNVDPAISLRIDGAGFTVDGQGSSDVRPFDIAEGTTVTLVNITITGGYATTSGVAAGGGIRTSGTLTITNSTVSGNSSDRSGGGIFNSGTLIVINSTVSGNSATGIGGNGGGGIANVGTLTVINSTVSDNSAVVGDGDGGGIANNSVLTIINSTVSGNSANQGGALYTGGPDAVLTLVNTIIANSLGGGDCFNSGGLVTDNGNNLIQDTGTSACGLTDGTNDNIVGVDPSLGPLQDNGGATFTHALLPGSPAIDNGDNAVCADPATVNNLDQRGVVRPQGLVCDIGAYEVDAAPITFVKQVDVGSAAPSEWSFTLDTDPTPIAHNQTVTLTVGNYTVTEAGPADYLPTAAGGVCALNNGSIALTVTGNGGTCTITNTRNTGPLTFVKQVVGGAATATDWSFTLDTDPTPIAHNQTVTLTVGGYTVGESGPADYTLTGASGACALNGNAIALTVTNLGGTCTITNTRNTGPITFIKDADGGPSDDNDWSFSLISGPAGATLPTNIANQQIVTLDTGVYIVSETGPLNYHVKRGEGVCALVNGQIQLTVTAAGGVCEVDNDRDAGEVRFIKRIANGASQPSDWMFNLVSGPVAASLPTNIPHNSVRELDTGSYVLTESGPPGYAALSASGACGLVNGQLQLNATITATTCTITNTQMTVLVNEFFGNSWVSEGAISGDGSQACVWLALNNEPSGPVTISLTPHNGQITLDKTSITLDGTNWNRFDLAQRDNILCVRAVDDNLDDSETEQCKNGLSERFGGTVVPDNGCGDHLDFVDLAISNSVDPNFGSFTPFVSNTLQDLDFSPASIDVLVQNNDQAGVTLTPAYGVAVVDEDGTPRPEACYWITLNSQPTHPVTVAAFPDSQVAVTPISVTLDGTNWDQLDSQQTDNRICVVAVNDDIDEPMGDFCADRLATPFGGEVVGQSCGDHLGFVRHSVASEDGKYNGTNNVAGIGPNFDDDSSTLDVLIRDDDVVGVRFIPTSLSIVEGNTGTYQVVLTSQPTGDVTVDNGHGSSVTFTPLNWNIPQTLSITIPDNDVIDGSREQPLPHQVDSSDAAYAALEPILPLLILDNDSPSVEIVGIDAPNGQLEVAEGGKTASYTMRLTAQPAADIVITPVVDDQVTVDQNSLTFTAANWNEFQTIVVTAVDDDRVEPTLLSIIQHTISSSDLNYNGQQAPTVDVQVLDNDVADIELVASTPLQLSEGALQAAQLTASYQLRLTSEPASAVTILVNIAGQATASPTVLTFTPADWNIFQSVTLTAIDDEIDQGTEYTALVSHTVLSDDPDYDGLPVTDLPILILDDDQAGVIVTPTALTVTVGLTGTYNVVLTSEPLGPVQIELTPAGPFRTVSSCDSGEAEGLCLTFTPANWNQPQIVTIFGLSAGSGLVGHQVLSNDAIYAAQLAVPVDVTVVGNTASNPIEPEPGSNQSRLFLPLVGK